MGLPLLFPCLAFASRNLSALSVMEMELLNCSICPKQPSFSDTSHLLTHVSSKGHLSHLHKLQVRSPQEIAASVQLCTYTPWYQHHDLGELLSERMVMKEAKKAGRKKAATKRGAFVSQPSPVDQHLLEPPQPARRYARGRAPTQKKTARGRRGRTAVDDDSDFEISPVRRSRSFACSLKVVVSETNQSCSLQATAISVSFSNQAFSLC